MLNQLKESKLIKSSFWYIIGNFFVKGISFITVPLFVRITTQSEYGLINNYTSFVSIFSILVGLSLNASVNNASFDFKKDISNFMSSILSLATLSLIFFLFFGNFYFLIFDNFFDMNQLIFNLMIIQSFSTFLVTFLQALYTINFQHFKFLKISLLSTALNICASVLLMQTVFSYDKYLGRVLGGAVGLLICGVFIYLSIAIKGKERFNITYWKYALRISLPLIPHSLASIMLAQFDRIMINFSLGSNEAGIYSYISNIAIILNVVWISINNSWVPWFYEQMSKKKYLNIKKVSSLYSLFFTIISMSFMVISVDLAKIMADSSYYSGIPLVIPICLGYFFQFLYSLPVNIEFYLKKTGYISFGTLFSAIVNIVLNLILIPVYGILAAGYTTAFTYFLLFLFHYNWAKRIISKQLFDTKLLMILTILMILFSFTILYLIDYFWIRYGFTLALILMIGVLAFILNKKTNK